MDVTVIGSGSSGNSYFVESGSDSILLDAGLPISRIQSGSGYRLSDMAAALITHSHMDHAASVKRLLRLGVTCYMPSECATTLGVSSDYFARAITPHKWYDVGNWRIKAFDQVHDVPCFGYIVDDRRGHRLVYITDTAYVKYRIRDITHLLLEANHSREILRDNSLHDATMRMRMRRLLKTHMSIETAIEFLKANDLSKLQQIWLVHLSDANSYADDFREKVMAVTGVPTIIA